MSENRGKNRRIGLKGVKVHFTLSDQQWKAFTGALERPARVKPRLRKLLAEPSILESR
jgi:uncharacterized protein (DUF1778 family)